MILQDLEKKKLISPPKWLVDNCQYIVVTGSYAYGVSGDSSDQDICGWCIPAKSLIFPHLDGELLGFGTQKKRFEQYEKSHVKDQSAKKEYDINIYNIVKYFHLAMGCNPNILDILFVPQHCVLHMTAIGNMVRENRSVFLSKKLFYSLKGYAFSQISKSEDVKREPLIKDVREFEEKYNIDHAITFKEVTERNTPKLLSIADVEYQQYLLNFSEGIRKTKRFESQKKFNHDVKFLYHLVRLVDECEQLLTTGTMDITRAKEHMKAVRRGEISEEDLRKWFNEKEIGLEKMYHESKLPHSPDEAKIKTLLVNCLEEHYGSLKDAFILPDAPVMALQEIEAVLEKHKHLFRK